MATTDIYNVSGKMLPSKNAIRCLGGDVDDYIQVNASAIAQVAGNYNRGTWSAWVNIPDITGTYTIIGAGDDNVVEFLELNIEAGLLTARCTDATVAQFVVQADAVAFTPHKWHHVALVQDGISPKLYVDGALIASTADTSTDLVAWFDQLDGVDTMRIGAANKAGDASVTNEFKGAISDVIIYGGTTGASSLTASEIKDIYEGTIKTGYYNRWTFDNDLIDDGTGADNGTNVGSGIILTSGYCEFSSRLGFMTGTPVVADSVYMMTFGEGSNLMGYATVIQAA